MIVIYNDNGQVSLPTGTPTAAGTAPAGSLSAYTSRLLASKEFQDFRDVAKSINKLSPRRPPPGRRRGQALPRGAPGGPQVTPSIDEYARGMVTGGTLFEELGFYYIGPVDGHDLDNLVPILENIRDRGNNQPVLLHIKTEEGQRLPARRGGVGQVPRRAQVRRRVGPPPSRAAAKSSAPSYPTQVFADTLIDIAANDRSVVAITAAMPGGTGVDRFGRRFPKRTYDVGIAEQHAVTFAAGLAVEGIKPFCAILPPARTRRRRRRLLLPPPPTLLATTPTTRWSTTARSRSCPSASSSTAPASSATTAPPTTAPSTSRTSAAS